MIKELWENLYQFENVILLDGTKIKERYPEFEGTPMTEAVARTIEWFRDHQS